MTQQPPGWDPYGQPQGAPDPYAPTSYGGDPYGQPPSTGQPASYGQVVPYQQPDYQAPVPAYQPPMQPMWANPPAGRTSGLAVASMVCSLVGLVLCYFAFILELLALIFGLIAKSKMKENGQQGSGMATAGIVISSIVLGLELIVVVGYFIAAGSLIGFGTLSNP